MKDKPSAFVERHRIQPVGFYSNSSFGNNGVFEIPYGCAHLLVIASNEGGWDHVSVSVQDESVKRCPTWDEMDYVRKLFFRGDEWCMQLHAPAAKNINCHPFCLHIWRPQLQSIPLPPPEYVGPMIAKTEAVEYGAKP